MAIVYVTEFVSQGTDPNGKMQSSAQMPFVATQTITASASSAATTNAFNANTTLVRVHNDTTNAINIRFAAAPTAIANSDPRLAANQTEYFTVPQNSGLKVAVINATI